MFINLQNQKVYWLPDDYEVNDKSLEDIKYNLNPVYDRKAVELLDSSISKLYNKFSIIFANYKNQNIKFNLFLDNKSSRGLDGTIYYPGYIGLNNLGNMDYANVILQTLCRVIPLRNYLLFYRNTSELKQTHNWALTYRFAELIRKIWSSKNFKGHVSPHEVYQEVSLASEKRFSIGETKDPLSFIAWFFNALSDGFKRNHLRINHSHKVAPLKSTIIEDTFQGEIEISTLKPKDSNNTGKTQRGIDAQYMMTEEVKKFLFLSLDVPPMPLFKDDSEKLTIPQIPLQVLLKKFDGKTFVEEKGTTIRKRMKLKKLPKYLIFHIKRFSKNQFFKEKNHTIINIPLNILDMGPLIDWQSTGEQHRYMLIANIKHNGDAEEGFFTVQVRYRPEDDIWYEIQDLHVNKVMPQQVAISESYILVYEKLQHSEEVKESNKYF